MNRNQRQYGRWCQKRLQERMEEKAKADETRAVERLTQTTNAKQLNRSCYTDSNQGNLQKIKTFVNSTTEKYPLTNLFQDQYGFDPALPENIVKEIQKVLGPPLKAKPATIVVPTEVCESLQQEKYSQYSDYNFKAEANVETSCASLTAWKPVEKAEDVDTLISEEQNTILDSPVPSEKMERTVPKKIRIAERPKLKVIAKVFSKYTKNVIELRKLEQKIVCVEYDVLDEDDKEKPVQKLRAFFRIKPKERNQNADEALYSIPTKLKDTYNLNDDDLKKLNEKEIEIIDDSIPENRPYLEDLKRVLKRNNEIYKQQKKNKIDLHSLYDMARIESPIFDINSKSNLFSHSAMNDMKDLIMQNCGSSAKGINRKIIKENILEENESHLASDVVSSSIVNELICGIKNM